MFSSGVQRIGGLSGRALAASAFAVCAFVEVWGTVGAGTPTVKQLGNGETRSSRQQVGKFHRFPESSLDQPRGVTVSPLKVST